MNSRYGFQTPESLYIADTASVGLHHGIRCPVENDPGFSVLVTGTWRHIDGSEPAGLPPRFGLLLDRCEMAQLIGFATAQVAAADGPEASAAFMHAARAVFTDVFPGLQELVRAGRACCEAAFHTGGREHICGRKGQR